jgi:hypothetical protein
MIGIIGATTTVEIHRDSLTGLFKEPKNWRPAFAGRQNQTQGVEARYAISTAQAGRLKEGLFAFTMMMKAVGHTNPPFPEVCVVRMEPSKHAAYQQN